LERVCLSVSTGTAARGGVELSEHVLKRLLGWMNVDDRIQPAEPKNLQRQTTNVHNGEPTMVVGEFLGGHGQHRQRAAVSKRNSAEVDDHNPAAAVARLQQRVSQAAGARQVQLALGRHDSESSGRAGEDWYVHGYSEVRG
jgi:hypothetical protein